MPDGTITFRTDLDNEQLEKELAKVSKKIENIERDIAGKQTAKSKWTESAETLGVQLDAAKAKLYEMQTAAKGTFPTDQIKVQEETVRSLQAQWNSAENQVEKYERQIRDATIKLDQQKERAGELTDQIAQATTRTGAFDGALGGVNKRLDKLGDRFSKLAARVFVFSMITTALRSLRTWMGDVISTNDEASAALARLKGALLTMVQPLVQVVIPAFTTLVNILTAVIGKIAAFISVFGGKTAKQSAAAAKSLNNEKKALQGAGGAAKEASKSLAGFDEINRLAGDASGGGGGGSTDIEPDFSWADSVSEIFDRIADKILLIGAGLALWKIGEKLPGVLGDIATTLGGILITLGGLLLMWDGLSDAWENGVDWGNMIEMILGLAAAAGGLYIAFGPVAAGIMLVVGGLALLVTGFHDAMENGFDLQNTLLSIAGIIATGLGITLLTGSLIPLLIAAIAALLLALTVATGHGEELIGGIKDICQGFVDFITGIFSGNIEKALGGIEQMFSGLKKSVCAILDGLKDTFLSLLNWLDEKTGGKFHGIIEFAKGLVTAFFSAVKSAASGFISGIQQIFSGLTKFFSGVFTGNWSQAWEGVKDIFKGCWNGIVSLLESAGNLIVKGLNWLISQMNKISFTAPDWVPGIGGKTVGVNIKPLGEISIPRLAQGAVIPPNREFMAVLGDQRHGTNIEAPLSTIQEAVALVMDDNIAAMMAGFEAVVQAIREQDNSVVIGDDVIARAVERYQRKMAVVRGGAM